MRGLRQLGHRRHRLFQLFDRTEHAWGKVDQWAPDEREFVRRGAFALLWSLALHRAEAPDDAFRARLTLIEGHADDDRHLVTKAITMATRAIAKQRPSLRADLVAMATRLEARPSRSARSIRRAAPRDL